MRRTTVVIAALGSCASIVSASAWANGMTERVSVSSAGTQGNDFSEVFGGISADGRYVTFDSGATNLVPGDTNALGDVFVRDRSTGQTTLVSVSKGGVQGDSDSYGSTISADGRFVAFRSRSTNLLPGNPIGFEQAYVVDRKTGNLRRASVSASGTAADTNTSDAMISADGRYVGFDSFAANLVSGDTNDTADVFVHDMSTGKTSRVDVGPNGVECASGASGFALSVDARFVAFNSSCTSLVPGGSQGGIQTFLRDRQIGRSYLVSVGPGGVEANGFAIVSAVSPDGRLVSFNSSATNLVPGVTNGEVQVYIRDRKTGTTELESVGVGGVQGDGFSSGGGMSADGRYVAFASRATNLVADDTNGQFDTFVHDRLTGKTYRVSVGPSGVQANGDSFGHALTANGLTAVFFSDASNLVAGDTNGQSDVFVHTR